nr:L-seryl-tRNA selenium transferase [uncultured Campylobacter sp.]
MKKTLIFTLLLSFLFLGCSTKRQYFEPSDENITGDMKFNGSLPSEIVAVSKDGATLKDGEVISKNGLVKNFKVLKSEKFLGEYDGNFVVTDINGTLKVVGSTGAVKFEKALGRQALSANIRGDDLALVMSDDSIMLIKLSSGAVVLDHKVGDAFAIDSRVASPLFINQLIAYPALDGLVSIAENVGGRSARDFVVSNQPFFNNIIALENKGDNLYAVTATRLMLVSPAGNKNHNVDIKDVIFSGDRIYLFLKDGRVELLDRGLNLIKSRKFTFAQFSGALLAKGYLYMIERTGYVIRVDENLEGQAIYELNGELDDKSFIAGSSFYYDDKILNFDAR